jgi:hypothetical protein
MLHRHSKRIEQGWDEHESYYARIEYAANHFHRITGIDCLLACLQGQYDDTCKGLPDDACPSLGNAGAI